MAQRRFGPRRPGTPYGALCALALLGCLPMLLLPLFTTVPWSSAVRGVLLLGGLGSWAAWMHRRVHLPDADEVLRADPRPHVLFLRTFGKESAYFSRKELPERLNRAQRIARRLFEDQFEKFQTLEKFLEAELTRRVGPFVALGDPLDRAPREGAARTYLEDDTWWQEFKRLAPQARCLVVAVHSSGSLKDELEFIREKGLQHKLFLFTPTYDQDGLLYRMAPSDNRLFRQQPERWENLVPFLKGLRYTLPEAHPGPGAVIGFGPDGEARVLTTGATTAAGYVTPLLAALTAVEAAEGTRP